MAGVGFIGGVWGIADMSTPGGYAGDVLGLFGPDMPTSGSCGVACRTFPDLENALRFAIAPGGGPFGV